MGDLLSLGATRRSASVVPSSEPAKATARRDDHAPAEEREAACGRADLARSCRREAGPGDRDHGRHVVMLHVEYGQEDVVHELHPVVGEPSLHCGDRGGLPSHEQAGDLPLDREGICQHRIDASKALTTRATGDPLFEHRR
jgi:hypothetical protein